MLKTLLVLILNNKILIMLNWFLLCVFWILTLNGNKKGNIFSIVVLTFTSHKYIKMSHLHTHRSFVWNRSNRSNLFDKKTNKIVIKIVEKTENKTLFYNFSICRSFYNIKQFLSILSKIWKWLHTCYIRYIDTLSPISINQSTINYR